MGKVVEIGIAEIKGNQLQKKNEVEALKDQGLLNDRKSRTNNQKESQLTLIEIENVNYYNNLSNTNFFPLDFRRNIVTENIRLNKLVGKEFFIGEVKLKAHDLCRPCKYLQKKLKQNSLVEMLLDKAGLRCEILTSGKISVGDIIKLKDD